MATQALIDFVLVAIGLIIFVPLGLRVNRDAMYYRHRLGLALAGSEMGTWELAIKRRIVKCDRSYAEMLGYDPAVLTGYQGDVELLAHPEDLPHIKEALESYLAGKTDRYEVQFRIKDANGNWRWVMERGVVVSYDRHNQPKRMVGITVDITEQKQTELKLRELSYTDPVTGLHNRAYFEMKIRELDREDVLPLSIIVGDLNLLKITNDTFGHRAGDSLLCGLAKVFRDNCRSTDVITRWGGDEFVILLPNTGAVEALAVCERIRAACGQYHDCSVALSAALGTATRTTMDEPLRDVLKTAEERMYKQKLTERESLGLLWQKAATNLRYVN